MYYYHFGDFQVVGASPEILVRHEREASGAESITIRPLAGTRPRGATPEQDKAIEQELVNDPKERAEHVMLIDLARNDIGRIAKAGSVKVTESFVVERYSHVMHIVSNVQGTLKDGMSNMDVLKATFPAGTLSGAPVDPAKVEEAFAANPDAALLAFVHAETSTGALSDAATLAAIARRHGALTIMDCVTSLGGVPVLLDEWGIDAAYSGSQKCLSCTPGLSPVSFSEAAVARIKGRKNPCPSWFQDLGLVLGYWSGAKRTYHHTAPVNPLYGLHESLVILAEEGLEAAWARHRDNHLRLRAGLEALGMRFVVSEEARLP